jgi:hypothetical protein
MPADHAVFAPATIACREQIRTAANVAAVRIVFRVVHFCVTAELAGPKLAVWSPFNPEESFMHGPRGTEKQKGMAVP